MSFGDRLRATRKERGFSQEQLAEELEVSRQSVTKWETGITFPEIRTMLCLATLLDRDLDWLLYDEKQSSASPMSGAQPMSTEIIPDRDTLSSIMKQDLLLGIINTLDGYEIVRKIDTDEFTGTQTYIFYKGRVFAEISGLETGTSEPVSSFSEMSTPELESLLLPWISVRRSEVGAQPQVAEKER